MTGGAFLFPTFTMRTELALGDHPGLAEIHARIRSRAEADRWIDPAAFRPADRKERLTADETLQAGYATFIDTIACAHWVREQHGEAGCITSFSMGLFSALAYAEAVSFEDGLTLLEKLHKAAVAQAPQDTAYALGVVFGLAPAELAAAIPPGSGLELSIAYGRVVGIVCGPEDQVLDFLKIMEAKGLETVHFTVPVPFHSSRLAGVRPHAEEIAAACPIRPPRIPLLSSSTARWLRTADDVRDEVVNNIIRPIRWIDALNVLVADGTTEFWECGFSRELGDLIRRDFPANLRIHQFVASAVAGRQSEIDRHPGEGGP
jgi:[acyl-carrier-protein] S-malonyltransferase